jgi:hypothetical protein
MFFISKRKSCHENGRTESPISLPWRGTLLRLAPADPRDSGVAWPEGIVAAILVVSQCHVDDWISGRSKPKLDVALKLRAFLDEQKRDK